MNRIASGLLVAVIAAVCFGAAGIAVKPLFEIGWTPTAAVIARMVIAFAVLALPACIALHWDVRPLWRARWLVVGYAVLGVACTQVGYYAAIELIPVSMGLLIEYLAPIVIVLTLWAVTKRAPQRVVLVGAGLALIGLVFVINPAGGTVNPLGVGFALVAMVGLCGYFVIAGKIEGRVPPVALVWAGFGIGAPLLGVIAALGVLPARVGFGNVALFGASVPWWVSILAVGVLGTAVPYYCGVTAIRLLGSRLASFVGLAEVLSAALLGWLVLGEVLSPLQLLGGAVLLAGVVCVKLERAVTPVAPLAPPVLDEPDPYRVQQPA
ncbi:MAG TPA: EamA family transporter [Candidatus Lumbricidophila sp.]|nr:EamA family transporter [Candidatus Lumbricidophila sp.]